jgi:pimeloyl-ACP methyl ester carboxylesterase
VTVRRWSCAKDKARDALTLVRGTPISSAPRKWVVLPMCGQIRLPYPRSHGRNDRTFERQGTLEVGASRATLRHAHRSRHRARLLAGLPVAERRLQLAGVSTAVLEGGAGPPIVLLHGPGEFARMWMRVISELATTHRVIAPDLPGHGTSVAGRRLDADGIRAWLRGLIEQTCSAPPVLVGHVLGGAIAARFALNHSQRLNRLVLVDSLG